MSSSIKTYVKFGGLDICKDSQQKKSAVLVSFCLFCDTLLSPLESTDGSDVCKSDPAVVQGGSRLRAA
jgi:hypothetical protein